MRRMIDFHQAAARAYVRQVLARTGWDGTTLARRAGLAPTTVTRFLNNSSVKHSLSARSLAKIAGASGLPLPGTLTGAIPSGATPGGTAAEDPATGGPAAGLGESAPSSGSPAGPGTAVGAAMAGGTLAGARDLPILGQARGGIDGHFFDNGSAVSFVERPWFLMRVPGAYAVYVNGDSMEPVYRHGHVLYVNPTIPPAPGDDVVIQLQDGQGFVKRLQRRTLSSVEVEQFNPPSAIEYPAETVVGIHLVVAALKVRS